MVLFCAVFRQFVPIFKFCPWFLNQSTQSLCKERRNGLQINYRRQHLYREKTHLETFSCTFRGKKDAVLAERSFIFLTVQQPFVVFQPMRLKFSFFFSVHHLGKCVGGGRLPWICQKSEPFFIRQISIHSVADVVTFLAITFNLNKIKLCALGHHSLI